MNIGRAHTFFPHLKKKFFEREIEGKVKCLSLSSISSLTFILSYFCSAFRMRPKISSKVKCVRLSGYFVAFSTDKKKYKESMAIGMSMWRSPVSLHKVLQFPFQVVFKGCRFNDTKHASTIQSSACLVFTLPSLEFKRESCLF